MDPTIYEFTCFVTNPRMTQRMLPELMNHFQYGGLIDHVQGKTSAILLNMGKAQDFFTSFTREGNKFYNENGELVFVGFTTECSAIDQLKEHVLSIFPNLTQTLSDVISSTVSSTTSTEANEISTEPSTMETTTEIVKSVINSTINYITSSLAPSSTESNIPFNNHTNEDPILENPPLAPNNTSTNNWDSITVGVLSGIAAAAGIIITGFGIYKSIQYIKEWKNKDNNEADKFEAISLDKFKSTFTSEDGEQSFNSSANEYHELKRFVPGINLTTGENILVPRSTPRVDMTEEGVQLIALEGFYTGQDSQI